VHVCERAHESANACMNSVVKARDNAHAPANACMSSVVKAREAEGTAGTRHLGGGRPAKSTGAAIGQRCHKAGSAAAQHPTEQHSEKAPSHITLWGGMQPSSTATSCTAQQ